MARVQTSPETALFESDGQAANLYAVFRKPNVIFSARLNGVPAGGTDQIAEIDYDGGVGTYTNVLSDMTLWIGSSAGKSDLGYARVRKTPTSTKAFIGEQSLINWADNSFLTFVDDYDLYGKHIRLDGTTPLMDYEIEYDDQHTNFNPVPLMGSHHVGKLVDGSVTIQLGPEADYDSWVFDSTITELLWECDTAVSISDDTIQRPTITFDAIGWHAVYLTATADNGKSRTGVRYVFIYDAEHMPTPAKLTSPLEEGADNAGINFSIEMVTGATVSDIPERALVILFEEAYYGTGDDQVNQSIGTLPGSENIWGVGRVMSENVNYNAENGAVTFDVQGYQELFKRINGFPSGVEIAGVADAWTKIANLTVDRGLWHFLEWRTTAITIMDVWLTQDARITKETSSPASTLWAQIQEFSFNQILAEIHVDCYGRLFAEIHPSLIPEADRDYPIITTLEKKHLHGGIEFLNSPLENVGMIDLSGIVVDVAGNGTGFRSFSPGHIPARTGDIQVMDRLLLSSQTQANELAGLIFAARNNKFNPLRIKLNANNGLIACFPNQAITFSVAAEDNPRSFAFTNDFKIIRRRRSCSDGIVEIELDLEAITTKAVSVTGTIPGSDDFSSPPDFGDFTLPPFTIPSLPGGGGSSAGDAGPSVVLIHDRTAGLFYSNNFNTNSPIWLQWNGGLTTAQYQGITYVGKTPGGAIYVAKLGDYLDQSGFLAWAPRLGAAFTVIADETIITAAFPPSPSERAQITGIGINPFYGDRVLYCIGKGGYAKKFLIGGGGTYAETALEVADTCLGNLSLTYGMGKWLLTCGNTKYLLDPNGDNIVGTPSVDIANHWEHLRGSTSGKTIHVLGGESDVYIGTDNLASVDHATPAPGIGNGGLIAIDPTATQILTYHSTNNARKSADGGYSFSNCNLPVGQSWVFDYVGGAGTASQWVGASDGGYIYYTADFWSASPKDKRGNIALLTPFPHLNAIKVIGL